MAKRPTKVFNDPNDLEGLIAPGTPVVFPNPSLAPGDFDKLIKNRGMRFTHYRAMSCPNVLNLEVQTHDPNCRFPGCENGWLYVVFNCGKPIHGIHQNHKLEKLYEIQGLWEFGEAVVTFQAYADANDGATGKGPAVDLKINDKLVCLDFEASWTERIEHSPSGLDRLKYPAVNVEHLQDIDRVYVQGADFVVNAQGLIEWLQGGNRPKADVQQGIGGIYSVLYTFHPEFYVLNVLHELRATKAMDVETQQYTAVRMPQQVVIRRIVDYKHPADEKGLASTRAPADGTLNAPT